MPELKLAFYKAPGNWVNRLVRLVTRSRYSHVEMVFADQADGACYCFSADSRHAKATRFQWMPLPKDHWDVVSIPCTDAQFGVMWAFARDEKNTPYDWLGVLRFVLPCFKQHPEAWFCSEVCATALQRADVMAQDLDPWRVSPGKLYQIVRGWEAA